MIRKVYLTSMSIIISAAHLIWLIRNDYDGTRDIQIEEISNIQIYHSLYYLESTASFLISEFIPPVIPFTSPQIEVLVPPREKQG